MGSDGDTRGVTAGQEGVAGRETTGGKQQTRTKRVYPL